LVAQDIAVAAHKLIVVDLRRSLCEMARDKAGLQAETLELKRSLSNARDNASSEVAPLRQKYDKVRKCLSKAATAVVNLYAEAVELKEEVDEGKAEGGR